MLENIFQVDFHIFCYLFLFYNLQFIYKVGLLLFGDLFDTFFISVKLSAMIFFVLVVLISCIWYLQLIVTLFLCRIRSSSQSSLSLEEFHSKVINFFPKVISRPYEVRLNKINHIPILW